MGGDYLLFVLIVSLGVLQLITAWGRLDGLSFFRRRYLGYLFAVVFVGVGYWWFFRVDRNIPDIAGGPSGPALFGYLVAGVGAAMLLTLIISSAVKARWGRPYLKEIPDGLAALKTMTYLQAIKRGFRRKKINDRSG
jgi:hypothetical protein